MTKRDNELQRYGKFYYISFTNWCVINYKKKVIQTFINS